MLHDIKDKQPEPGQIVYGITKGNIDFPDGHRLRVMWHGDRFVYSLNSLHYAYIVLISMWEEINE